jgi:hypothetical protein
LKRCHNHYGVKWPEHTTLGCSQILGDHLRVIFIQFGG